MKRYALLALLCLFLLPLSAQDTGTAPPDLQKKLERLKEISLQREKHIIELSRRLEQARSSYEELKKISGEDKKRLQRQEKKINDLESRLQSARESWRASQKELQKVKKQLRISERSREKVEQSLQDYSRRLWIERATWGGIGAAAAAVLMAIFG